MKIETEQLIDVALDWAVGHAMQYVTYGTLGWTVTLPVPSEPPTSSPPLPFPKNFSPSTRWAQAGPLLQVEMMEHGMSLASADYEDGKFTSYYWSDSFKDIEASGPTPLIAAMRTLVRRVLGDVVDVPDELLEVKP